MIKEIINFSDKEWSFSVRSDFICSFNWAEIAIQDVFEWLSPISPYDENLILPKIKVNFVDVNESIHETLPINFKLFERIDEKKPSIITVRSYYFDKIMLNQKTLITSILIKNKP